MKTAKRPSPTAMKSSTRPEDVRAFEERAIHRLRAEGFRITMPRVQVIRTLAQSNEALSAYGIHERILANGGRIDVVSVYRILATLNEVGLIHHIGVVDGYLACRLGGEHVHQTEHLVCSDCGNVQEVEVPAAALSAAEAQISQMGFDPSVIKIEVVGRCNQCSKSG
ncbi:MAG TPA: Fur family transcriptional regulator [Fimbriimonadaceae bacterium]|nr:Fur family transcriptional regulator [Fimbriimonadaceae bacterium]